MVTCRFPKIKGLIGFLIGQRAKHFGIALAIDLRIPESGRFWLGRRLETIPLSFASAEFFYHQTTHRHL